MKNQIRVTESKTGSLRFHTYVGGDFAPAKGVSLKAEEAFELVKSGKAEFVDIYSDKEKTFNYISVSKNGTVKVHSVHRTIDFEYRMSKDPDVAYLFEASDESTGGLWNGPVYDRKYAVRVYPSEGYWDNAKDAYFGCGAEEKAAELGVKSPAHKAYDLLAAEKAAKTVEAEIAAIEEYAVSADAFEAAVEAEIDAAAEFVFDVQAASDGETVIGIELDKLSNHDAELVRKIDAWRNTFQHLEFCNRILEGAHGREWRKLIHAIERGRRKLERELDDMLALIYDYYAHERVAFALFDCVTFAEAYLDQVTVEESVESVRQAFFDGEFTYEFLDAEGNGVIFNPTPASYEAHIREAIRHNIEEFWRRVTPNLAKFNEVEGEAYEKKAALKAKYADAQTFPPRSERTGSDKDANVEPDTESVETAVDLQATADEETGETPVKKISAEDRNTGLNSIERTFEYCHKALDLARETLIRAFEKRLEEGEEWQGMLYSYNADIRAHVEKIIEFVESFHPDVEAEYEID